jgi:phosphoserine phosphatase
VTGPIANAFGVAHLIAAEPELDVHGQITGRHVGTPPFAEGKVINLHQWLSTMNLSLAGFDRSTFYSDSQNDIPLLSAVSHPVATNPNAKLTAHAQAHGWPILHLFHD